MGAGGGGGTDAIPEEEKTGVVEKIKFSKLKLSK